MPTTLTITPGRDPVVVPVGSDVVSLPAIVDAIQKVAGRAEWASKSLVAGYTKVPGIAGDDYNGTATYATLQNPAGSILANFALTVSVGDLVWLSALGSMQTDTDSREYFLRWTDGTAVPAEQYFRMSIADHIAYKVDALHIVTTAGAKTYALQGKRGASSHIVQGSSDLYVACIHAKLGAT